MTSGQLTNSYRCFGGTSDISLHCCQKSTCNRIHLRRLLCSWFRASLVKFLITVQRDATLRSLLIILQVHSTCFGCQPHPSSGVHKTVTTVSGTGHIFVQLPPSNVAKLATLEGGSCTSTVGCSYSFVYSWRWVWLAPETCRLNLQNNK